MDDLEIIQEQMNESVSKPTRFKRAFNNVKSFLTNSTAIVGTSIALGKGLTELIRIAQPIIDKLGG